MSSDLGALDPVLQQAARALVDLAGVAGVQPRVTSTRRSRSQQEYLYRQYREGHSRYPAAPPGSSSHEYGLAFDLVVATDTDLADLGQVWQSWGGVWGGSRDPIHFEFPDWKSVAQEQLASAPQATGAYQTIAQAADILLGFQPEIGIVELVAWLLSLGFKDSEVLKFLAGPFAYTEAHGILATARQLLASGGIL